MSSGSRVTDRVSPRCLGLHERRDEDSRLPDDLAGGVGLRSGRRHRDRLRTGDTVDFRRVEQLEPGRLYWYGMYPLHALVFRGMLRGIVREARSG